MQNTVSDSMNIKYVHDIETHNLISPQIIIPEIIKLLNPKSVIDIGCGTGTFLNVFEKNGITDFIGVDGPWVVEDQLMINKNHFVTADLEKPFDLKRQFDLVVCLEVVEHLAEVSAETIIQSLINHGKTILFSAAIKNQGGLNHINEQNFDYWQQKFKHHGYYFYDAFRSQFWENKDVQWWYKQNMFLVIHESVSLSPDLQKMKLSENTNTYVHPDSLNFYHSLYLQEKEKNQELATQLKEIYWGNKKASFYIKNLLKKIFKPKKN